jgi:hypothetical protein
MDDRYERRSRLVQAIVVGTVLGALGTGVANYVTAEDSIVFDRGDQALFGAVAGAIGGAVVGIAFWTLWLLVDALLHRERNQP